MSTFPAFLGNLATESMSGLENVWAQTVAAMVAAIIAHLIIRGLVLKPLDRLAGATSNDLDDRLVHFLRSVYKIALIFGLVLVILRIHGIAITPLLASAGIMGIALGLAAKETLADILAGVFLITDHQGRITRIVPEQTKPFFILNSRPR